MRKFNFLYQLTGLFLFILLMLAGPKVFGSSVYAATVGNTAVGGSIDFGDSNEIDGSRFTMGATTGTVSSMSVYVANIDPAPNNQYRLAIYTDLSNKPKTLVATSAVGTLTANSWNTLPVAATLTANTKYWLVYTTNGLTQSSNNMRLNIGSGLGGWTNNTVPFNNFPQTFPASSTAAQNFSIYATYSTTPDTTPPTVSVTSPVDGSTVSGTVNVTANAADNIGVANVQFQLDGSNLGSLDTTSPYSVSWNTSTLLNGNHTLTAIAKDAAGNTTTSNAVAVSVNNPPVLNINQPSSGAVISGTTVDVGYSESGDLTEVNHVHFYLDGGSVKMDLDNDGFYQFNNIPGGPHSLVGILARVDHSEIAGTNKTVNFTTTTPDTTAPTVAITAPLQDATVSGTLNVNASAADNVGVVGVQFILDGTNLGAEDTTSPYSVSWNTTLVANGTHTLVAKARDAAANLTTSDTVTVNVSNVDIRSQIGQWSAPFATPVVWNTLSLLPSGKVIAWGRNNSEYVWDPASGNLTNVPINLDLLCASQVFLPDGKVLVAGGGGLTGAGIPNVETFNPVTQTWTNAASFNFRRWYPTLTELPDGKVIAISGSITNSSDIATIPEVYNPLTNTWTRLNGASKSLPFYPFMFVLPDGRLIHVNSSEVATPTEILDPNTQTWTTFNSQIFEGGSAAQLSPGKYLKAGSAADSGNSGSSVKTAFVLDMNQQSPSWQAVGSMASARAFLNLTNLPDGTVIATGGETTKDGTNENNAVKTAEIFNPLTSSWSTMAAMVTPRLYHSTALLLADGRVLVSGSGDDAPTPDQKNAEIYSPPYLFKGSRPTISSVPSAQLQYGANFFVGTPNGANIASVSLISPGGVTHSFNMSQHFIPLQFSQTGGGLTVQAPSNANLAQPGQFMLFIVNSNGVPSLASWVKLPSPLYDTQAPTVPLNLTATGATGSATLAWNASTDDNGVDHYNIYRGATSGFAPSGANKIAQSTTTAYTNSGVGAGTYYYLVTAVDGAGNESSPSNEASADVTVETIPPTVLITAPVNGATVSGTLNVSVNASDNVLVSGVQLKLDGNNLGAVLTTSPYNYSWNTTSVLNGTHVLTAVASDNSGNSATSDPVSVTVSNTAPVTLVGNTVIETGQDSNSVGNAEAFRYTALTTGTAKKLYLYLNSDNSATSMVVGLYSSNGTNPGNLLTTATLVSVTNGGWNSVTIPDTQITAGINYWIAVLSPAGGGVPRFRNKNSGNLSQTSSQNNLSTLPATWSAGTNWPTSLMSAYITQQ